MNEKNCPKCHFPSLKTWEELTAEEKMIVERRPAAAGLSIKQRRKNRFCPRCGYEQTANFNEIC